MQPHWFLALLRDPGAVKPRTRMPNFFPDGVSQHPELLDGDRDRQIAAMWGYLTDITKQPLPAKIEEARSADYELRPTDRPIILRTFMREAGTHAIAVGFPQSINIAIDANQPRLAALWRGRFLDAQGTWFVRAAPPADPLGDSLVTLSPLASFTTDQQSQRDSAVGISTTFRGYRVDNSGVPTFLYRFGTVDIEETIQPAADNPNDLVRRLVATFNPKSDAKSDAKSEKPTKLLFRALSGSELKTVAVSDARGAAMVNESGLMVAVDDSVAQEMLVTSEDGAKSWVLSITMPQLDHQDSRRTWELRYSW
jgi:hypothetical protein